MDDLTHERYPGVTHAELQRERAGRPLRRHPFHASKWRDHRGVAICETCGSTRDASVHRLPERTDEQREHEDRKVGER